MGGRGARVERPFSQVTIIVEEKREAKPVEKPKPAEKSKAAKGETSAKKPAAKKPAAKKPAAKKPAKTAKETA